ncbi:MAG TPA: HigA family addiction module antitoxin [Candidatus Obscuribacterales bacterium]
MIKLRKAAYNPDFVSPPGETLQETLDMHGLSQAELAARTGRPKKTINEIVQGKAAITPETAMQFELVLGVPATFWLARESKYRAWLARQDEDARIEKDVSFLDELPIKEMVEFGWIEKSKDKCSMAKSALSYFGVVSSSKVPLVEEAAFRRSEAFATNPWALAAWLRKGEIEAQKVTVQEYDRDRFLDALNRIRILTVKEPAEFVPEMLRLCAGAGVIVLFIRELPKTSVSGATRWLSHNRPLIQLTLRHKANDMFWFSFFHEAGHVYHEHAKREVLLEAKFQNSLDHRESTASRFAMDLLIPPAELAKFLQQGTPTQESICKFARSLGIAPGIVLGRLQFERNLDWNQYRGLKKTYSWDVWPVVQ